MSTKMLRAALETARGLVKADSLDAEVIDEAAAELDAIERAADVLDGCDIGPLGHITMEECNTAHNLMGAIAEQDAE